MKNTAELVQSKIRDIQDFPKAGILFKDITTAMKDADTLSLITDWFYEQLEGRGIDYVIGIEARGFFFAPLAAYKLGAGFIPVRKPGKLPAAVESESYALEYGTDSLEIHKDAIEPGKRVAIIDDVLATGGTAAAVEKLVQRMGAEVALNLFLIELAFLDGRGKLSNNAETISLIKY